MKTEDRYTLSMMCGFFVAITAFGIVAWWFHWMALVAWIGIIAAGWAKSASDCLKKEEQKIAEKPK